MQLRIDEAGENSLRDTVLNHYEQMGKTIKWFSQTTDHDGWYYQCYLLDRKHVFRYGIGEDRRTMLGSLELAIGPHYFGPSDFWDYANSDRFSLEASTEAVEKNLNLLDEFLGYRPPE